jgi:hypothetical protein
VRFPGQGIWEERAKRVTVPVPATIKWKEPARGSALCVLLLVVLALCEVLNR